MREPIASMNVVPPFMYGSALAVTSLGNWPKPKTPYGGSALFPVKSSNPLSSLFRSLMRKLSTESSLCFVTLNPEIVVMLGISTYVPETSARLWGYWHSERFCEAQVALVAAATSGFALRFGVRQFIVVGLPSLSRQVKFELATQEQAEVVSMRKGQ